MKKTLITLASLIWLGVGTMLFRKGAKWLIEAWNMPESSAYAVGLSLGIAILIGLVKGRFVLSKSALKNRERISKLKSPKPWNIFALKFYPLVGLMMGAGFFIRGWASSGLVSRYVAGGLYCGIGGALFVSAFAYWFPKKFARKSRWRKDPGKRVPGKIGIILANLGTPDAPTPNAVGRFLREFLSDPRVIEVPKVIWFFILNCFIVPFRKYSSAELYKRVFTEEGSPLLTIGQKQAEALKTELQSRRPNDEFEVGLAMRYGNPSIPSVIETMKSQGCERFFVIPAYAQYSNTTTASIYDAAYDSLRAYRFVPALRLAPAYADHPGFIDALAARFHETVKDFDYDHLVLSYHGIPVKYCQDGDPYAGECVKTTRALIRKLGLKRGDYTHCYQSQFGGDKWLGPATDDVLEKLAAEGKKRVAVICPAFLVDCLETIDEIGHESLHLFKDAGGEDLRLIPCVNDHKAWIHALGEICEQELQGWLKLDTTTKPELPASESEAKDLETKAPRDSSNEIDQPEADSVSGEPKAPVTQQEHEVAASS